MIFCYVIDQINMKNWTIISFINKKILKIKIFSRKIYPSVLMPCGAFDRVTDCSVLSNPADAQNVSCLGLCGRDICPKSSA